MPCRWIERECCAKCWGRNLSYLGRNWAITVEISHKLAIKMPLKAKTTIKVRHRVFCAIYITCWKVEGDLDNARALCGPFVPFIRQYFIGISINATHPKLIPILNWAVFSSHIPGLEFEISQETVCFDSFGMFTFDRQRGNQQRKLMHIGSYLEHLNLIKY